MRTQRTSIDIKYEPKILIVLFYDKKQNEFYGVYNGSGKDAWNLRGNKHQNGEYSISINKLSEINKKVRNKLNKSTPSKIMLIGIRNCKTSYNSLKR